MLVKGNHPLAEIIAKKLLGIEGDLPLQEKRKMISRAAMAAVKWHEEHASDKMSLPTDGQHCNSASPEGQH